MKTLNEILTQVAKSRERWIIYHFDNLDSVAETTIRLI